MKHINLPKKWCIRRTSDNFEIINDFFNKNSQYDYSAEDGWCHSEVLKSGSSWVNSLNTNHKSDHTEITFEEFQELVLKQKKQEVYYECW